MSKNKAAYALARMRQGIKERPSVGKRRAALRNLASARQKRWPKPSARTPEPPEVEPPVRYTDLRDLLVRGIAAAEGAQVLAECYFERAGRDGFNNDNYCRLLDWLKDARRALGKQPNAPGERPADKPTT